MTDRRKKLVGNYCLRCHRHLSAERKKIRHCESCGFNNLEADHKEYWSLSPILAAKLDLIKHVSVVWMVLLIPSLFLIELIGVKVASVYAMALIAPFLVWFSADRFLKKGGLPTPLFWCGYFLFGFLLSWGQFGLARSGSGRMWLAVLSVMVLDGLGIVSCLFLLITAEKRRRARIEKTEDLERLKKLDLQKQPMEHVSANYCLRCFQSMPSSSGVCPACSFNNMPSDRRVYWNKNPRILTLEISLKAAAVALGLFLSYLSIFHIRNSMVGSGWAIAMNFAFVYALSLTFSKLSRHMPSFKPSLVWSSAFVMFLMTLTPFALFHGDMLPSLIGMFVCLVMVIVPQVWARIFVKWKKQLQTSHLA